jgi:hypothetical protein
MSELLGVFVRTDLGWTLFIALDWRGPVGFE